MAKRIVFFVLIGLILNYFGSIPSAVGFMVPQVLAYSIFEIWLLLKNKEIKIYIPLLFALFTSIRIGNRISYPIISLFIIPDGSELPYLLFGFFLNISLTLLILKIVELSLKIINQKKDISP